MPLEIERKFLLLDDSWRDGGAGVRMSQGYLSRGGNNTVRVRLAGDVAWITIKGPATGNSRAEYEYEIPPGEARELLGLCLPSIIEKTRHEVRHEDHVWEIDVFHGENEGLVVAEVELEDESTEPGIPPWIGKEVSDDRRYSNSSLALRPYWRWKGDGTG